MNALSYEKHSKVLHKCVWNKGMLIQNVEQSVGTERATHRAPSKEADTHTESKGSFVTGAQLTPLGSVLGTKYLQKCTRKMFFLILQSVFFDLSLSIHFPFYLECTHDVY